VPARPSRRLPLRGRFLASWEVDRPAPDRALRGIRAGTVYLSPPRYPVVFLLPLLIARPWFRLISRRERDLWSELDYRESLVITLAAEVVCAHQYQLQHTASTQGEQLQHAPSFRMLGLLSCCRLSQIPSLVLSSAQMKENAPSVRRGLTCLLPPIHQADDDDSVQLSVATTSGVGTQTHTQGAQPPEYHTIATLALRADTDWILTCRWQMTTTVCSCQWRPQAGARSRHREVISRGPSAAGSSRPWSN
jgi:hypothetical protein